MKLNLQQQVCIKFCIKNGFNGVKTLEMLRNCFGNDTLKKTSFMSGMKKPLRGTHFNNRKEEMEKSKTALMAIPTIEMFRELDQAGISALQSMGSTLKRTISLLMNKICILNFLNEFRELFDQVSIYTQGDSK